MSDPAFIEGIKRGLADGISQLKSDPVSSPAHYAGDGNIEAMDAMYSMMVPIVDRMRNNACIDNPILFYWWGCAFKYLWRWPLKNGVEDLKKCRQCIDYLIEEAENRK